MATKNQTEPHTANSRAAMARLIGTATKFTQTFELSPILQLLIRRDGSIVGPQGGAEPHAEAMSSGIPYTMSCKNKFSITMSLAVLDKEKNHSR